MTDQAPGLRAAQAATLFLVSATAGASLSVSVLVIPRLLESPTPLMLRQWRNMFEFSKWVIPGAAEVAAAGYVFFAYRAGLSTLPGKLYLLASALSAGIVPYTLAVIMPTNRKLFAKADEVDRLGLLAETGEKGFEVKGGLVESATREESAKYLVDRWGVLNLGRSVMLAASGLVGLWTSL